MPYIPPKMKDWINNQNQRRANIPYPTEHNVIYERESENPYWEIRRKHGASLIPSQPTLSFQVDDIKSFLSSAADFEFQKEQDFLNKFYKGKAGQGESHIDKFNILFQSREQYQTFNNRINDILTNKQFQENKDKSRNEFYTGMAPNLASVFASYFEKHFNALIYEMYSKINPNSTAAELSSLCDQIIRQAILNASEEMANIQLENANEYGSGEEWRPIYEMLKNDDRSLDLFSNTLKEAIGFTNFDSFMQEMVNQRKNKQRASKKRITKTAFSKLANVKGRTASIGGSILEPVIAIMANSLHGSISNGDMKLDYKMLAENIGGSKVMTDMMMLWTTNIDLDLQPVMDELRAAMTAGDSAHIREVYRRIQEYYNNNLKDNLDDLYTVFVNAKNYGLGANGRNYTKSYSGDFEELPYFLTANGINTGDAKSFLSFAYNTGAGAINGSYQASFMEECTNALKAAAANIMFDDYETIGHGQGNTIHMYYLSGKYIPASTVFKTIVQALEDAKLNTNAKITLPNKVEDNGPIWPDLKAKAKSDAAFKEELWKHWEQEANDARTASTWSVSFTLRIKDLLAI